MTDKRRVAVMQPYFFPYAGYFSLIKHVDQFVILDCVQFIRGWIDRNRILKQAEGWLYIRAPLASHPRDTAISEIRVDNNQPWRDKLLAQLTPYKRTAPFYDAVRDLVCDAIATDYDTIAQLNKATLSAVCGYLGFACTLDILSTMNLTIDTPTMPDEWPLNVCRALEDVGSYLNPPGGQNFYDRQKYQAAGIDIAFLTIDTPVYDQRRPEFTSHLSIIDTLMFNSPGEVCVMLDSYTLS